MARKSSDSKSALLNMLNNSGKQFSDVTLLFHGLVAEKAGLTGADHKYLGILVEKGAMTAGELAAETGLTKGAITGVIDRLEKEGLVKRLYDDHDRRKVMVVPNKEKAFQRLAPIFRKLEQKLADVYEQFSEKDMATIIKYLTSVSASMQEVVEDLKAGK